MRVIVNERDYGCPAGIEKHYEHHTDSDYSQEVTISEDKYKDYLRVEREYQQWQDKIDLIFEMAKTKWEAEKANK